MASKLDQKIKTPSLALESDLPRESGGFEILECKISSPSNDFPFDLNIAGRFVEMNIYEDLFSNVLKGTLTILDTQGLAELIPLIGDETLLISFSTPGGAGTIIPKNRTLEDSRTLSEETVRQRFKVYDCKEIVFQNRAKSYELFFVSEEYMFSSKTKVSKGYRGQEYSVIVKDVITKMNENIKEDDRKSTYIEKTGTPQNVIIPNWSPLQAINFCASRSLSEDITPQDQTDASTNPTPRALGSLFVFYEKLGTGFFYESIETMIRKQKSQRDIPLYLYTPKIAQDKNNDLNTLYFGVDAFDIMSSFKTLENLKQGLFGSTLIAYDPIRMKYDKIKYDYHHTTVKQKEQRDAQRGVTVISPAADNQLDNKERRFHDFIATDIGADDSKQNKLISTNSDLVGSNDTVIKLATTTKDHGEFVAPAGTVDGPPPSLLPRTAAKSSYGVSVSTFQDKDAVPNRVEDWLLQRQAQIQEFGSIVVNFSVPGNSSRHVGDLIRFEIPTTISDDDPEIIDVSYGHKLYSGFYIVSKIRHIIDTQGYKTDIELIKNSFAERLAGQTPEVSTDGTANPHTR